MGGRERGRERRKDSKGKGETFEVGRIRGRRQLRAGDKEQMGKGVGGRKSWRRGAGKVGGRVRTGRREWERYGILEEAGRARRGKRERHGALGRHEKERD